MDHEADSSVDQARPEDSEQTVALVELGTVRDLTLGGPGSQQRDKKYFYV